MIHEWRIKMPGIDYYMPIMVTLIEDKYQVNEKTKLLSLYDEKNKFPAHDFVIRPLLENCIYSYVYGINNDSEIYKNNMDILIKEKGKYKLDTTKECIKGHEYLWNAYSGKRGSIIIIIKNNLRIFNEIFKYTYNPDFLSNPNNGNTISAVRKCKEEVENGNIAICLGRNNGIECMEIYLDKEKTKELYKIAERSCKNIDFKTKALKILEESGK
jgi:hypothetical protein